MIVFVEHSGDLRQPIDDDGLGDAGRRIRPEADRTGQAVPWRVRAVPGSGREVAQAVGGVLGSHFRQRLGGEVGFFSRDEAGIDVAGDEPGMLQAFHHEGGVGPDRPYLNLAGRFSQRFGGLFPRVGMHDQLGDHRVVELADLAAFLDAGIDPNALRHDEMLEPADAGQEALGRVLGVQAGLHGPAVERDIVLFQRHRLARGDAELPFDQIDAGHSLGDRVFDLQPGVHLHEPDAVGLEPVGGVGDEFDGACALVVHRLGGADGGVGDGLAGGGVHAGGGGFLDHLLVAALQGAVALIEVDDGAVRIPEHLHLDVARAGDVFLDQDARVAEGGLALALGRGEAVGEVFSAIDLFHPLAAAAGDGLDQHRIADGVGFLLQAVRRLVLAQIAGGDRHAGLDHQGFGGVLQTHGADGGGGRADPDQSGGYDGLGKVGVLGQEAIARVDGLGARGLGGSQNLGGVQIGFAGRGRADQDGLIGLADVQRLGIGFGIDGDGPDAHAAGSPEDATGDLATIGDQDGFEHGRCLAGLWLAEKTWRIWARTCLPRSGIRSKVLHKGHKGFTKDTKGPAPRSAPVVPFVNPLCSS